MFHILSKHIEVSGIGYMAPNTNAWVQVSFTIWPIHGNDKMGLWEVIMVAFRDGLFRWSIFRRWSLSTGLTVHQDRVWNMHNSKTKLFQPQLCTAHGIEGNCFNFCSQMLRHWVGYVDEQTEDMNLASVRAEQSQDSAIDHTVVEELWIHRHTNVHRPIIKQLLSVGFTQH